MEPTTRFQQALPYLLLPASQPLSALHSARVLLQSPPCPQNPSFCSACGACLHIGTSHSRLVRSKAKKSRVFHTTCLICDHVQMTPLEPSSSPGSLSSAGPVPDIGDDIPSHVNSPQAEQPSTESLLRHTTPSKRSPRDNGEGPVVASSSNPQTPRSTAAPQSRTKKKASLQAMLARNREKEQVQARERSKNNSNRESLSAFLSGL